MKSVRRAYFGRMDDLFGILQPTFTPAQQLLTAVSAGLQDVISNIISEGKVDLNSELLKQNGNTALHIACQKGYHGCARRLIKAGAHIDVRNKFGITPLCYALKENSVECARVIFERGSFMTDVNLVWTADSENSVPYWSTYHADTITLLLIASPCLPQEIQEKVADRFLLRGLPSTALLRTFFITGHSLPPLKMSSLISSLSLTDKQWMKKRCSVQSLQFYSRLAIRRNMNCNVFYGGNFLPIPQSLVSYLTDCSELGS